MFKGGIEDKRENAVEVKEMVEDTKKGGRVGTVGGSRLNALDAPERREYGRLPHAVPARAVYRSSCHPLLHAHVYR